MAGQKATIGGRQTVARFVMRASRIEQALKQDLSEEKRAELTAELAGIDAQFGGPEARRAMVEKAVEMAEKNQPAIELAASKAQLAAHEAKAAELRESIAAAEAAMPPAAA